MKTLNKPRSLPEWYEWAYSHNYSGLDGLEQAMFQSIKCKVCVNCLSADRLVLQKRNGVSIIKSTDYYMCEECTKRYES